MKWLITAVRQLICRHRNRTDSGGYDWTEQTCQDCGLMWGVGNGYRGSYGEDWR